MNIRSFVSCRELHLSFHTSSGSRLRKLYQKATDKNGAPTLIDAGVEDVYDSIQKAAVGITVEDLIRRASNGDTSAIPEVVDSYPDLSHCPKDMLEAHTMLTAMRLKYDTLPAEIRSKYGNSFDKFLAACADGSVLTSLKSETAPSVTPLTSEEIEKIRSSLGGSTNA